MPVPKDVTLSELSRNREERGQPAYAAALAARFDEIYAQHASFVFRLLRGMGVPDALADDATQDVFLVVHRRLHEFDGRARVSTWLFQITLHVARNYRRRYKRMRDHTPIPDTLVGGAPTPHEQAEDAEGMAALHELLDGLDEEKRLTLVLADIEELTAPEIAAVTGTPLNTVYTRLRRARAAFGALWRSRAEGKSHG